MTAREIAAQALALLDKARDAEAWCGGHGGPARPSFEDSTGELRDFLTRWSAGAPPLPELVVTGGDIPEWADPEPVEECP